MGRKLSFIIFFIWGLFASGQDFPTELKISHGEEFANNRNGKKNAVFDNQTKTVKKSSSSEDLRMKIWVRFKSPQGYDREILVTADSNATPNFDLGYDAPLIEETPEDMYWTVNGNRFVIQAVPDFNKERELKVGIRIGQAGNFSIDIKEMRNIPSDKNIFLKDSLLQVVHNLKEEPYFTESEIGVFPHRFKLIFYDDTSIDFNEDFDENVDEDDLAEEELEALYSNKNREILVRNPHLKKIRMIYLNNMVGQQVEMYTNIFTEKEMRFRVKNFTPGIYILKVHTEEGVTTKKIFLN